MPVRKLRAKRGRKQPTSAAIASALNLAVQDAVEAHRHAGLPLVGSKNGKIIFVSPDSIETDAKRSKKSRKKAS